MAEAFLVGGVRTPVGRYGGALAGVRPDDLAALVVGELVRRTDLDRAGELGAIDEVILGAANQAGEDNRNVARMSVLLAGLPDEVPGITVNRLCASGMSAIAMASQAIRAEDDLVDGAELAGAVEVGATHQLADHERGEVVGPHARERTAVASDRGAHPAHEEGLRHAHS